MPKCNIFYENRELSENEVAQQNDKSSDVWQPAFAEQTMKACHRFHQIEVPKLFSRQVVIHVVEFYYF